MNLVQGYSSDDEDEKEAVKLDRAIQRPRCTQQKPGEHRGRSQQTERASKRAKLERDEV